MKYQPLSEQLRPKALHDIVGQDHLLGPDAFLGRVVASGKPVSILLWGPPGCGKTSIARVYAQAFEYRFVCLSAVFSGVADLRKVVKEAQDSPLFNRGTVLFVDEIHRFNKAQQDAFLPYLEDGTLVLVGATTENPSFHLNDALLSRTRVLTLNPLDEPGMDLLLGRFETRFGKLDLAADAKAYLIKAAQGDGRHFFNLLENVQQLASKETLTLENLEPLIQKRAAHFDRGGDQHYNLISALHKAVRGSDPDGALYWLARMLEGGEDPLFIARRLIRMASEDIGLADPQALPLAVAARDAFDMLGSPEGDLALAQAVVYLALAPKSNAVYQAFGEAKKLAGDTTHLPPPKFCLNAPNRLMKEMDYGKGYQYDHSTPNGFSGQNYFPEELDRQAFYRPPERGFEREMVKRIRYFGRLRGW